MGKPESLATKIKDKVFVGANLNNDAFMKHIKTFFLPRKHVKIDVRCSLDNCKVSASSINLAITSHPMCFCYTCNRTFHVVCVGLNLQSFKEQRGPLLCIECKTDPINNNAVDYYTRNDWTKGIENRRIEFLKATSLSQNPDLAEEQLTDDEFDEEDIQSFSAIDNLGGSVPLNQYMKQQHDIVNLSAQLKTIQAELQSMKNTPHRYQQKVSSSSQLLRTTYIGNNADVQSITRPPNDSTNEIRITRNKNNDTIDRLLQNPDISLADRVLLESTKAQIESNVAQQQVSNAMALELKRKALPRITKYKGDAKGWIRFKMEIQRYQNAGCFEEEVLKMYILGALEGVALNRVQDMIDMSTLEEIMKILETSFGHSPSIIKSCEVEILNIKLNGELMRNDVVQINSLIQTYFTACRYANVKTLNSNMLASHIINQFSGVHKLFFRQHYHRERPNDITLMADLDILFTFLEEIASDLEVRLDETTTENIVQVNSLASNCDPSNNDYKDDNVENELDDAFKYEIKDKNFAKYLGYDLKIVDKLEKYCYCCEENGHFTIECVEFKSMTDNDYMEFVINSNLCRNCLLTDNHKAYECNIKLGCGFKSGTNRCALKHHILLHDVQTRRYHNNRGKKFQQGRRGMTRHSNYHSKNENISSQSEEQSRQSDIKPPASIPSQSSEPAKSVNFTSASRSNKQPTFIYNVAPRQTNVILQNDRTVKIFKHYFYGPHTQTIGYSMGDSGSEVTLMREDLRKQLGIQGTTATINMQWTDGSIKTITATKVTLELQGLANDAQLVKIQNCYAVNELNNFPTWQMLNLTATATQSQF